MSTEQTRLEKLGESLEEAEDRLNSLDPHNRLSIEYCAAEYRVRWLKARIREIDPSLFYINK